MRVVADKCWIKTHLWIFSHIWVLLFFRKLIYVYVLMGWMRWITVLEFEHYEQQKLDHFKPIKAISIEIENDNKHNIAHIQKTKYSHTIHRFGYKMSLDEERSIQHMQYNRPKSLVSIIRSKLMNKPVNLHSKRDNGQLFFSFLVIFHSFPKLISFVFVLLMFGVFSFAFIHRMYIRYHISLSGHETTVNKLVGISFRRVWSYLTTPKKTNTPQYR